MGRFRRRKPAVAWLPHVAHDATGTTSYWYDTQAVSLTASVITTSIYSLVPDYPAEAIRAAGALPSLADFEAGGYRLRRLVGKIFVGMDNEQPSQGNTSPVACLAGAGFIVLRVEEQTGAPLVTAASHYSPLDLDATRDPWIWRRTWLLQNDFSGLATAPQAGWQFPRTNCDYGSVQDGPHIDAKTARRIGAEERLFFVMSNVPLGGTTTQNGLIRYALDYRVLASPIKIIGNRRNASR